MNMKKATRGIMIATVLALSINSAIAVVSDQSTSALKARDWVVAEKSLKQDLKQDNQDPKVWYNLSMVLNHARKPEEAMKALNNAVHLDKTMSFAKSRQNVFALRDTIQSNIKVVQNARNKPSASTQNQNVTRTTDYSSRASNTSASTSVAMNKPATTVSASSNKTVSNDKESGSGFGSVLLGILVLLGLGGAGWYVFNKRKEKEATKADQSNKLVKLEEMFTDISNKVDFIKAMDKSSTDLGRKMSSLKDDILSAKASNHIADYQFSELQSEYRKLVSRFDSEQYDAPVVASQPVQQRREVDNDDSYSHRSHSEDRSSYGRTDYQRTRHDNSGYNGGGTTVVNNHYGNSNNGSDLITGMAMGTILANAGNHGGSHHDTIIEREVVREQPRQDSYNYGNDTDDFATDNDSEIQEFAGNSDSDWGLNSNDSDGYQQADSLDDFTDNDSTDYNDNTEDDWAR